MKLIKQNLYSIKYGNNNFANSGYVIADNINEALEIAKQVATNSCNTFTVKSVGFVSNCYKSIVKTVTIEV